MKTLLSTPAIPNKFQSLIEAHDVSCYTSHERFDKSIILSNHDLNNRFLPPLVEAAINHVHQRQRSIMQKTSEQGIDAVVEALYDSHFRKQRNFGPSRAEIKEKVKRATNRREPITLVALMFTRKNICALKRSGNNTASIDLAEIVSLVHLNAFAELIGRFHPYGARYIILSEGTRFLRTFDLTEANITLYQSRLVMWANRLNLHHLEIVDYEQFLSERLNDQTWRLRIETYEQSLINYRSLMEPIFDPKNMITTLAKAKVRDPVIDPHNPRNNFVPLWDSIKHSLPYPENVASSNASGIDHSQLYQDVFSDILHASSDPQIENLRISVLKKSWAAAIEHNARVMGDAKSGIDVAALLSDAAFRTTINPKPGSPNLGIYSVRETTSRVQPWHGTAYLRTDGSGRLLPTVLSLLEIESRGGIPVCISSPRTHPFFYIDPTALPLINSKTLSFNMSTR